MKGVDEITKRPTPIKTRLKDLKSGASTVFNNNFGLLFHGGCVVPHEAI